tara:strand:- start:632 stop:868 length:237 start_codon:yes stop_codon:yes gene_type:complete
MSTTLRKVPNVDIHLNRFAGGVRGQMVQLTTSHKSGSCGNMVWFSLTREEAGMLAQELLLFSNGFEVEDIAEETYRND